MGYQVVFLKSFVWPDLGLKPGLTYHWQTLYPLDQRANVLNICINYLLSYICIYIYIYIRERERGIGRCEEPELKMNRMSLIDK